MPQAYNADKMGYTQESCHYAPRRIADSPQARKAWAPAVGMQLRLKVRA